MHKDKIKLWLLTLSLVIGGGVPFGVIAAIHSTSSIQKTKGYYPSFSRDLPRITQVVNNNKLVSIKNSMLSPALKKYDTGLLPSTTKIADMTLILKRSAVKQGQFETYLGELTRPGSPYFHHWLTPDLIGKMFGPASVDIQKVTQWLESQGLTVKSVSPDGMIVHFSGSASAVQDAFHSPLHSFTVNGKHHYGNLVAQKIPEALSSVVRSAILSNFFPAAQHIDVGIVSRDKKTGKWRTVSRSMSQAGKSEIAHQFTVPPGSVDTRTSYDMTPADFDQIYNVNPLWAKGMRGAGQTIVLLERTDVNLDDVAAFRKAFLPPDATGTVTIVHPSNSNGVSCQDPGITTDEAEAALDAEWAGAAAPDADIVLASCADAGTSFGALLAANFYQQSGSSSKAPPIFSLSYGACELKDPADAHYADILWSSLAAEGSTVFVSSDDAGSAGCDQGSLFAAEYGPSVNGLASSPSAVAVGGTDFNDVGKTAQYWTSNNMGLYQSAISYIPEQTWNDSCASSELDSLLGYSDGISACNDSTGRGQDFLQIGGGGGGQSFLQLKPEWQIGVYGSTSELKRTLPDISLFSGNGLYGHALIYCMSDPNENGKSCDYSNPDDIYFNSAGGTSFAAPAMAGVQALINQATGGRSGNILPALYRIATEEYGTNGAPNSKMLAQCNSSNGTKEGSDCIFNDVTVGNIVQPCFSGTLGCYSGPDTLANDIGVTVASDGNSLSEEEAWSADTGYDMATGLGSINVNNLVNAMVKYDQSVRPGYVAPADYLSLRSTFSNDGYSDIALVDPDKGIFSSLAMKGNVVMYDKSRDIDKGYTIGAIGNFSPSFDKLGLKVDDLVWTGPDHRAYLWASTGTGGFFPMAFTDTVSTGWELLGSGIVDSSGVQELFWFNPKASKFGWWKTDLSLLTGQPTAVISPLTSVAPGYTPRLADVNGDDYVDLIWTSNANNSVYVWINDQHGGFVKRKISDHAPGFQLFGAGDINGDGKTDLIWINPNSHQMSWWVMNGFTVSSMETRNVTVGYAMASISDYNGDGLADILWVGTNGDAYEWQSTGSSTGPSFRSVRVVDSFGNPLVIPAGARVQPNRLQGSAIAGHN